MAIGRFWCEENSLNPRRHTKNGEKSEKSNFNFHLLTLTLSSVNQWLVISLFLPSRCFELLLFRLHLCWCPAPSGSIKSWINMSIWLDPYFDSSWKVVQINFQLYLQIFTNVVCNLRVNFVRSLFELRHIFHFILQSISKKLQLKHTLRVEILFFQFSVFILFTFHFPWLLPTPPTRSSFDFAE